jgi:hypothetical protein
MSDVITKLVNDAGDLRTALSDTRYAHMNKTTVVHSNAMGILTFIMGYYFKDDPNKEQPLHRHLQMVYDWLEYSHGLPAGMFTKMQEGNRVWYSFRNLYEMYEDADTKLTFSEWMAETEKKTDHAG